MNPYNQGHFLCRTPWVSRLRDTDLLCYSAAHKYPWQPPDSELDLAEFFNPSEQQCLRMLKVIKSKINQRAPVAFQ